MKAGPPPPGVAGVILAAGRSTRMGAVNKLLLPVDGAPMVRRVVETALGASLDPVVVVLGHEADEVRSAVDDLPVRFLFNPDFAQGLSTSVACGVGAVTGQAGGALILLADMPWVTAGDLRALVAAFAPDEGRSICAPVAEGKRGNPVLWARRYFSELRTLEGDVGARHLLSVYGDQVFEVAVTGSGVLMDVDAPDALGVSGAGDA